MTEASPAAQEPQPTMPDVQLALPWALGYSEAFEHAKGNAVEDAASDGSSMSHLDFTHAVLHIVKATGKLAAMSENADHGRKEHQGKFIKEVGDGFGGDVPVYERTDFPLRECEKLTADLVICAMRLANVRPGGAFDLWGAVLRRIDSKNGSNLAAGREPLRGAAREAEIVAISKAIEARAMPDFDCSNDRAQMIIRRIATWHLETMEYENLAAGSGISAASPACASTKPSGDSGATRGEDR